MDPDGRIRSMANLDKCLEAGNNVDLHARLKVWDCHDGIHQQWEVTPEGKIRSKKHKDKYIGVAGGCDGINSGDRLEMQQNFPHSTNNIYYDCKRQQMWVFRGSSQYLSA